MLSRVTPQCKTGYVSMTHACTAQAAADSKESKLLPWHLFQTISARPADSMAAPPACWVTNKGATTSWQAPNEGRRGRHPRHHKQLSSSGRSLAKGTDVLGTLISPENTIWLISHVFSSLEEEDEDKKPVNNTQYSTYLKNTTSRHSCWFQCVHTSCRDLPCSLHLREQPDIQCKIKGQCLSI